MNEFSFQHYLLGLVAVANNIPAIPFFLELCEGLSLKEQHKLAIIATITSFITMITAMIAGMSILGFFDISIHAFRMAGGLLLLNTGLNMMNSTQQAVVQSGEYSFLEDDFYCGDPHLYPTDHRGRNDVNCHSLHPAASPL